MNPAASPFVMKGMKESSLGNISGAAKARNVDVKFRPCTVRCSRSDGKRCCHTQRIRIREKTVNRTIESMQKGKRPVTMVNHHCRDHNMDCSIPACKGGNAHPEGFMVSNFDCRNDRVKEKIEESDVPQLDLTKPEALAVLCDERITDHLEFGDEATGEDQDNLMSSKPDDEIFFFDDADVSFQTRAELPVLNERPRVRMGFSELAPETEIRIVPDVGPSFPLGKALPNVLTNPIPLPGSNGKLEDVATSTSAPPPYSVVEVPGLKEPVPSFLFSDRQRERMKATVEEAVDEMLVEEEKRGELEEIVIQAPQEKQLKAATKKQENKKQKLEESRVNANKKVSPEATKNNLKYKIKDASPGDVLKKSCYGWLSKRQSWEDADVRNILHRVIEDFRTPRPGQSLPRGVKFTNAQLLLLAIDAEAFLNEKFKDKSFDPENLGEEVLSERIEVADHTGKTGLIDLGTLFILSGGIRTELASKRVSFAEVALNTKGRAFFPLLKVIRFWHITSRGLKDAKTFFDGVRRHALKLATGPIAGAVIGGSVAAAVLAPGIPFILAGISFGVLVQRLISQF